MLVVEGTALLTVYLVNYALWVNLFRKLRRFDNIKSIMMIRSFPVANAGML